MTEMKGGVELKVLNDGLEPSFLVVGLTPLFISG